MLTPNLVADCVNACGANARSSRLVTKKYRSQARCLQQCFGWPIVATFHVKIEISVGNIGLDVMDSLPVRNMLVMSIETLLGSSLGLAVEIFISSITQDGINNRVLVDMGVETVGVSETNDVVTAIRAISDTTLLMTLESYDFDDDGVDNAFDGISAGKAAPCVFDVDASEDQDDDSLTDTHKAIIGSVVGGVALLILVGVAVKIRPRCNQKRPAEIHEARVVGKMGHPVFLPQDGWAADEDSAAPVREVCRGKNCVGTVWAKYTNDCVPFS